MNTLVALHGFLGLPQDWEPILGYADACRIYPNIPEEFPIISFDAWSAYFNAAMDKRLEKRSRKILIGYSLGGRLALHALKNTPDQWDAAVIISSHQGLVDEKQKSARIIDDALWAERMRTMPWNEAMHMWNSRDIFAGDTINPKRNELDYDREKLAEMLKIWTLGSQDYLQNTINCLRIPILWVVGDNDATYVARSSQLRFQNPLSKVVKIKDAGHRVLWYSQKELAAQIYEFIGGYNDDNG